MSKIDEIMRAALTLGDQRLMATHNRATREDVLEAETAMRDLIAAALADAERKGAEAMREAAGDPAQAALDAHYTTSALPTHHTLAGVSMAIRALPLPTGERQAVLLTDEQIAMALHVWAGNEPAEFDFGNWRNDSDSMNLIELWRYVEAAAIAANGLDSAR